MLPSNESMFICFLLWPLWCIMRLIIVSLLAKALHVVVTLKRSFLSSAFLYVGQDLSILRVHYAQNLRWWFYGLWLISSTTLILQGCHLSLIWYYNLRHLPEMSPSQLGRPHTIGYICILCLCRRASECINGTCKVTWLLWNSHYILTFFLMYVIGILPFQFEIVLAWLLNVFNLTCEYSFSFTYILFFFLCCMFRLFFLLIFSFLKTKKCWMLSIIFLFG